MHEAQLALLAAFGSPREVARLRYDSSDLAAARREWREGFEHEKAAAACLIAVERRGGSVDEMLRCRPAD